MKWAISFLLLAACGYPEPHDTAVDASTGTDAPVAIDAPGPVDGAALLAVRPPVAKAGDTITLEGTFAGDTTVAFPGGASVPATILGSHRATAIVPAGATAGDLRVITNGTTSGAVSFRRATFDLGLQPFQQFDDQTNGARQMPSLTTPRAVHASVTVGKFVYVIGGAGGGASLASVERAAINADGSLGPFAIVPGVTLTAPRAEGIAVTAAGFVYVMGGFVDGQLPPVASIERAAIHADGSLDTFVAVPDSQLTQGLTAMRAAVIGDSIYVVGGRTTNDDLGSSGAVATVQRAIVAPDGELGPFAVVPDAALVTARENHELVVAGSSLIAIAGVGVQGRAAPLDSIEVAPIHADGSIGTFATSAARLGTARGGFRSLVIGSSVFALGGLGAGGVVAAVERSSLATDGTPLGFAASSTLPSGRSFATAELVGNHVYLIGGSSASGLVSSLLRAEIDTSGGLDPTAVTTRTMSEPRFASTALVLGDAMYVLGAGVGALSYDQAPLDQTGSLGAFGVTVAGPPCLERQAAATIGSFVYLLGGAPCQNTALDTIQRATIGAGGTLGAFVQQPGHLAVQRASASAVVAGNNLYVIGGFYTDETSIERATINADGSIGALSTLSVTTTTPRMDFSVVVLGHFLYLVAGSDTAEAGGTTAIERVALNDDGSFNGSFTVSNQLTTQRAFPGLGVIGGFLYVFGGTATGDTSAERAPINADGSLGTFGLLPGFVPPGNWPVVTAGNAFLSCTQTDCTQLTLD